MADPQEDHAYKVGDWVVWLGAGWAGYPVIGSCHQVVGIRSKVGVLVAWAGSMRWPMYMDEIRLATLEEVSAGHLLGQLSGL